MTYKSGAAKKGNKTYYYVKNIATNQIDSLCTKYLKLKGNKRSNNTVKTIARSLANYMNFITEQGLTLQGVTALNFEKQSDHFYDFLMYIKHGCHTPKYRNVKNNTANTYLQNVFGFFVYLHRCSNVMFPLLHVLDLQSFSYTTAVGTVIHSIRVSFDGYLRKNEHGHLTASADDVRLILSHCKNIRDRLLILILEETGIRIGEALGIRHTEDIDYINHQLYIRYRDDNSNNAYAKYAEERTVKISDDTFSLLNIYISEYSDLLEKTDYLFVVLKGKTKGNPLSPNTFYKSLQTIGRSIGIHVTNHMLRHYFAEERRKAKWDIPQIGKALGHKHITTTEQYLHVSAKEVDAAQNKYLQSATGYINVSDYL